MEYLPAPTAKSRDVNTSFFVGIVVDASKSSLAQKEQKQKQNLIISFVCGILVRLCKYRVIAEFG